MKLIIILNYFGGLLLSLEEPVFRDEDLKVSQDAKDYMRFFH